MSNWPPLMIVHGERDSRNLVADDGVLPKCRGRDEQECFLIFEDENYTDTALNNTSDRYGEFWFPDRIV